MAIPSRQIGQSVESNFLWQISSQMDRLIKVTSLASSSTLLSLKIVNNLSDLNNVTTARTNLGLGSFALKNSLISGDIPNNAANTSGTAAGLSSDISESQVTNLVSDLSGKQPTLVSGTNIKTINGSSILGSGNLSLILGDNITIVTNYSALPLASSVVGNFYWVQTSQGTKWLPGALGGNYYPNGIYYSNGTTWEFIDTPYQAVQGDVDAGIITDQFVTPFTLKNSVQWASKQASLGFTPENIVNKDATGGYVGMTGFNYNFRNVANTFTSYLTNTNTASRTYTFPDVTTTMAGLSATQTFTGLQTFQGTVASDTAPLGSELTTTGTVDASWTGTAFSTGYTHVPGSITTITTSLNAVINTYYQITTTITGRTAGSVITDFGGISSGVSPFTNSNSQIATTTGSLIITPTTDFDGTIVVSIKTIGISTATTIFKNSSGSTSTEIRVSSSTTNTFVGLNAGSRNTTGINNTGIGTGALQNNTIGSGNTADGRQAMNLNTEGANNSAFGYLVLSKNTIGGFIVAMGYNCLANNTIGNYHTSVGGFSLFNLNSGNGDTAMGYQAGRYIANGSTALTTANNSLFVGFGARAQADNQTNQVVIGGNIPIGLGSNTTVLGNSSTIANLVYGNQFFNQPVPTVKNSSTTLTIANLLTNLITTTSTIAVTLTLPSGTLTDAGIASGVLPNNTAFEWTVLNLGSSVGIITMAGVSDNTLVGNSTIIVGGQATFRTTKTATNTFVTYRVY